jgi:hypothetical protein
VRIEGAAFHTTPVNAAFLMRELFVYINHQNTEVKHQLLALHNLRHVMQDKSVARL